MQANHYSSITFSFEWNSIQCRENESLHKNCSDEAKFDGNAKFPGDTR